MDNSTQLLENRIRSVKAFLNAETVSCRLGKPQTRLNLREIGYHLDAIHELERQGIRNLSEMGTVRLQRILGAVETLMVVPQN